MISIHGNLLMRRWTLGLTPVCLILSCAQTMLITSCSIRTAAKMKGLQ
jgi:hypothetical protein